MKEALIHEGPRSEIVESSIPTAGPGEVVIKVEVSGTNPKDWKTWWAPKLPINMGDDIAGTIHEVGQGITGFNFGDRVFAYHQVHTPHGGYAEFAVTSACLTSHLAPHVTFKEAATIPLAALTASLALFRTLRLPQPWCPATSSTPLLIYGGSSAVGAFAIKLAVQANLHPIIAIAGAGCEYVLTLLDVSKGDVVVDYRLGLANLDAHIRSALSSTVGLTHVTAAFDTICEGSSSTFCVSFLDAGGKLAHVLPVEHLTLPDDRAAELIMIHDAHEDSNGKSGANDFGYIMMRAFARGLERGWLKGHPHQTVPGGLRALSTILDDLKERKPSALKYVLVINQT